MLTKSDVLREIPLRAWKGEFVPYKEFVELKRMAESFRLEEAGLQFILKEIIARREALGLKGGTQAKHTR